ncbi:RNA polymerase subunit sigma [Vibrio sp. 10N.286.49.B3]|uniref:sigma-70 family RNA polymerase sigma factor n=1 Tax=Vibrio sp. 10N.286.49.B3 TaxID=1880855 RepID=UPI000C85D324|nr:sigma-70 family RNA polymerase sigma factor [Vibrio sp. 10N.286.49.B3]PMH41152.1 RNA polymerase subunit sigma [Vibrio sp. 10N.286.49.B3]
MTSDSSQTFSKQEWSDCMEKVKQKDKRAFALIFHYFSPRLKPFTFKYMGNEQVALEMVQETLAIVWQKAPLFDGSKSALSTWIYTIARNLCFDTLRKQRGQELHLHAEDIWPEGNYPAEFVESDNAENDLLKAQVLSYLDALPEKQKLVVKAIYVDDLPQHQVAEIYSIPLGTVKSRLRLGVEKLKDLINMEQR